MAQNMSSILKNHLKNQEKIWWKLTGFRVVPVNHTSKLSTLGGQGCLHQKLHLSQGERRIPFGHNPNFDSTIQVGLQKLGRLAE